MKWKTAFQHPLRTTTYLLWRQRRRWQENRAERRSREHATFSNGDVAQLGKPVFELSSFEISQPKSWLDRANEIHSHRFDLLGSGPAKVQLGLKIDSAGQWLKSRLNSPNFLISSEIWKLVSKNYSPIDWQIDFKSGQRWKENLFCTKIPIIQAGGSDIKVPWELSRSQHLPQLAIVFSIDQDSKHPREFRDQVLDFMAQNPPLFGVNWKCPMDVAIRAVNWIVAYDLFCSQGFEFDSAFQAHFARSLFEHGDAISRGLEWHPFIRSNHYLANICGLIFISSRLQKQKQVDRWFDFCFHEFQAESNRQFLSDGANFESSSSYHRLSAEMLAYTAAVISISAKDRLQGRTLSTEFFSTLEKSAEFSMHISKHHGRVAQIGDNDSGRFLKLELPISKENEFLDHRQLVSLINGFFSRQDLDGFAGDKTIPRQWLDQHFSEQPRASYRKADQTSAAEEVFIDRGDFHTFRAQFLAAGKSQHNEISLAWPHPLDDSEFQHFAYPKFGAYIFKTTQICLVIRCGSERWDIGGGHAHNDQLSFDLEVEGEDWVQDPGTYLYTPEPEQRNLYRSSHSHFAPSLEDQEQSPIDEGLFLLRDTVQAQCLHFKDGKFIGVFFLDSQAVYRQFTLSAMGLVIRDWTDGPKALKLPPHSVVKGRLQFSGPPFSCGYGQREKASRSKS